MVTAKFLLDCIYSLREVSESLRLKQGCLRSIETATLRLIQEALHLRQNQAER